MTRLELNPAERAWLIKQCGGAPVEDAPTMTAGGVLALLAKVQNAESAQPTARDRLRRAFWRLTLDAAPAHDNPGDEKWRLTSSAARILADTALVALTLGEEAPACKTCGGKGYTEHEGGDGEGWPSKPEIEACAMCEEAPAEGAGDLERQIDILRRASQVPIPDDDTDFDIERARRGAESWREIARNTVSAYEALRARTSEPEAGEAVAWVARVMEVREEASHDGVGAWTACSGCQESVDGQVSSRDYPYSAAFGCQPGGGCSECGGLGVKWDTTDWDEAARWMLEHGDDDDAHPSPATADKLREALERLVSPHVDDDGIIDPETASSIVGRGILHDGLRLKGSFMAALENARAALATLSPKEGAA